MRDPFETIPTHALGAIHGGWEMHASGTVFDGFLLGAQIDRRGDTEYRREIIEQACKRKFTNHAGQLDEPKIGQCMLDHLDPRPPR